MSSVLDLPNRRVEAWKYSDLRAAWGDAPAPSFSGEGDVITRLARSAAQHHALTVADGEHKLQVLHVKGDGAEAYDVEVGVGARFDRVVMQTGAGVCLARATVRLQRGAQFRQMIFAEGGRLARIETHVTLAGEGAQCAMSAAYCAASGRHADLTSGIVHEAPLCVTHQTVRGVVRSGGRGVFQGKIIVAEGAQKTDARQHHDALLLEEGGEIDAKPELEIYADDVQCAHGNTVGALDDAALFYMRARGIPDAVARALLIEAFVRNVMPDWLPEAQRADIEARMAAWLGALS